MAIDALISTRASQGTARAALATSIDALVSARGARGMPRAALVASRALRRSTENISRCDDGRSRVDESGSRRLLRGRHLGERPPGCPERRARYVDSRARRRKRDKNVRLGGDRPDLRHAWHTLAPIDHFREALCNPRAALGTSRASVALARDSLVTPCGSLDARCEAPGRISSSILVSCASAGESRASLVTPFASIVRSWGDRRTPRAAVVEACAVEPGIETSLACLRASPGTSSASPGTSSASLVASRASLRASRDARRPVDAVRRESRDSASTASRVERGRGCYARP